ncbi:5-oxoprolinase subunit B family protein [Rhodobacter maris]|uniref:KipI family sensor histidine kinase inhibitor n=1 Tax=Rhodobacter maris TaxID=446682 RepID=A0A285SKH7_9RHOB|nr:carboxyltransferase domain-containing protein [Rhodobacter maris]SOC08145.1 KipI family sensor histidine kinase inhibitor [Rhodobacter maris]
MMLAPEILPLGLDALLIRYATTFSERANRAAQALAARLEAAPLPGQTEVSAGLGSVLLRFDREATTRAALQAALQERLAAPPEPLPEPRHFLVPACFGDTAGPQLAEAAALAGRSETALVAELCATELHVLALGFAPGQPYLGMLPEHWQMPRMDRLTPRVEPGTITTAIRQIVLFAAPSPTGWRALGRCALRPFAPGAPNPFALRPGDRLRFTSASAPEIAALEAAGDPMGGTIRSFLK